MNSGTVTGGVCWNKVAPGTLAGGVVDPKEEFGCIKGSTANDVTGCAIDGTVTGRIIGLTGPVGVCWNKVAPGTLMVGVVGPEEFGCVKGPLMERFVTGCAIDGTVTGRVIGSMGAVVLEATISVSTVEGTELTGLSVVGLGALEVTARVAWRLFSEDSIEVAGTNGVEVND